MLFNDNDRARPTTEILSREQKLKVHKYSVKILNDTGIMVESKSARDIFARSGGVRIEDNIVFIDQALITNSINTVRSTVEIYSQTGEIAFSVGKGNEGDTRFGIGVTNTSFQDIETDRPQPFTRQHMQACTRLGQMLENFDMVSTIGIPNDAPVELLDLYCTLDMYAYTDKPLVLLLTEEDSLQRVLSMLEYIHGDIYSRPFIIPYVNLITPLKLNKSTTDKMKIAIENDLPVIFSNYGMYGGTSPMSEGGTLALLNAELLAGLVFSQQIKEGSKLILGSLPAAFDMRLMGSYYSMASYNINLACAEMMDHYKIPHCGTSGSGKGWGPDLLSAGDLWLNHITSCTGKIGMAPFVGGNFDSLVFSPATVVLSDFIIGETRKFSAGFSLESDRINLKEINDIGHGGNFFLSEQTLETMSEQSSNGSFWPPMNLSLWVKSGYPAAKKILIDHTKELYDMAKTYVRENREIIIKGESYLKNLY